MDRRQYDAPERLACITSGEHMADADGEGWCCACGYHDPSEPRDDAPNCNCSQCPSGGPYTCTRDD